MPDTTWVAEVSLGSENNQGHLQQDIQCPGQPLKQMSTLNNRQRLIIITLPPPVSLHSEQEFGA